MTSVRSPKNTTLLAVAALAATALNALFLHSELLGIATAIALIASLGALIGRALFPNESNNQKTALGSQAFIAILAITGSIAYYLTNISQALLLILLLIITTAIISFTKKSPALPLPPNNYPLLPNPLPLALFAIALSAWILATRVEILQPVRSIWEHIPPTALLAFFLAATVALILQKQKTTIAAITLSALLFFAVSLTATSYPLGYGFDPFIHRSTVAHIAEFGTITPKPAYYIGQYALELFGIHAFSLPLAQLDPLLLPILAILFLIPSVLYATKTWEKKSHVTALLILLFPLSGIIMTTPQGIAYLFLTSLLFLSIPSTTKSTTQAPIAMLLLLAAATAITHPIAGIPAILYTTAILIYRKIEHRTAKYGLLALLFIASAVSVPASFILQASAGNLVTHWQISSIFSNIPTTFLPNIQTQFSSIFDLLYLCIQNLPALLLLANIAGVAIIIKTKKSPALLLPAFAALAWFLNYWILQSAVEFEFLIEYERQNYAERLELLTLIFLLPLSMFTVAHLLKRVQHFPLLKGAIYLALATLITANVYGAYPRHDNYARSAGFNVGQSDFDAVYAINTHAKDTSYIVLANQATSAAALEAFGFKTYFHEHIFYYPIPTGGELYQIYLQMTDEFPANTTAQKALELTGATRAYFVVNDYWWQSEIIIERAKKESHDWFAIGEKSIHIFIFEKE